MNEMIERVAKAMMAAYYDKMPYCSESWEALARAAIAAMRNPTEKMLDAGATGSMEDTTECALGVWHAMIDEALGG